MNSGSDKTRKTDRRTKYTIKAIMDAYLQLINEKPHSKIKITEICELAEINRCTFYLHFDSIDAVEKAIEQSLLEKYKTYVNEQKINSSDRLQLSNLFSERILQDNAYITMMKLNLTKNTFPYGMQELFRQSFIDSLPQGKHLSETEIKILYNFIVGGAIAVNQNWILSPPEDVALENSILDRVVHALIDSEFKW